MKTTKQKLRMILAQAISLLPINFLRVSFYRIFMGYTIHSSYIGWKTVIAVDTCVLSGVRIGSRNIFSGPISIHVGHKSVIEDDNKFICRWWTMEEKFKSHKYKRSLFVGERVLITSGHYVDLAGSLRIEDDTWIGHGTQFWTHGAGVVDRDIVIGKDCYIGGGAKFAPGSLVSERSLVALGSVVVGKFLEENVLIGGNPAKIIKSNYDYRKRVSKE